MYKIKLAAELVRGDRVVNQSGTVFEVVGVVSHGKRVSVEFTPLVRGILNTPDAVVNMLGRSEVKLAEFAE